MHLKTLIAITAVPGGVLWIAKLFAERANLSSGLLDGLLWAGLVLMSIAFFGSGINLVGIGKHWLELIVGLATTALVWSVEWAFKGGSADDYVVDAVFGGLVVLYGLYQGTRGRATLDDEDDEDPEDDKDPEDPEETEESAEREDPEDPEDPAAREDSAAREERVGAEARETEQPVEGAGPA